MAIQVNTFMPHLLIKKAVYCIFQASGIIPYYDELCFKQANSVIAYCNGKATILPILNSSNWRAPLFNSIKRFIDKRMIAANVNKRVLRREGGNGRVQFTTSLT